MTDQDHTPAPRYVRPYRQASDPGEERTLVSTDRVCTFRQLGWHGHSGAFYALDENPAEHEPAGFGPLWLELDSVPREPAEDPQTLTQALALALNRFSEENTSNTPDFLLAEMLIRMLEAFAAATLAREAWYGVKLEPGQRREEDPGEYYRVGHSQQHNIYRVTPDVPRGKQIGFMADAADGPLVVAALNAAKLMPQLIV